MSLFTSFGVGVSGLRASQSGINTAAHNISNTKTEGYTRQQGILADRTYATIKVTDKSMQQVGYGVNVTAIRQIRDQFLDKQYRLENSRRAFYEVQYNTITEVEDLLGELEGVEFEEQLEDLWNTIQILSTDTQSITNRELFISKCSQFLDSAKQVYNSLKDYQINLNDSIQEKVDRINEIGEQIDVLNDKISFSEASGLEHANDYRDARNQLLDELSALTNCTYREQPNSRVIVYINSAPLVTETRSYHMKTEKIRFTDDDGNLTSVSEMYKVVWSDNGFGDVYDLSVETSRAKNTDTGSLLGVLTARGQVYSDYSDIPIRPDIADFDNETDYYIALNEYNDKLDVFEKTTQNCILTRVESQMDQLIHQVTTLINDAFSPNITQDLTGITGTDSDGNTVNLDKDTMILDVYNCAVGTDDGASIGTEVFSRKNIDRYNIIDIPSQIYKTDDAGNPVNDADGNPIGLAREVTNADGTVSYKLYVYNREDTDDKDTLYSLANMVINQQLSNDYSLLPVKMNALSGMYGSYNSEVVESIIKEWEKDFAVLDPDNQTKYSIDGYYQGMVVALGNEGNTSKVIMENQQLLTDELEEKRQQVSGVSTDEEMAALLQYQHMYNASSRYITVIDQMLQHIIERLGS